MKLTLNVYFQYGKTQYDIDPLTQDRVTVASTNLKSINSAKRTAHCRIFAHLLVTILGSDEIPT